MTKTEADAEAEKANETDQKGDLKAAVAQERAEKRAARAEADAAKKELADSKQSPVIDSEVLEEITKQLAAEAKAQVDAATKPLRDEVSKYKVAMQYGLNETQANKLMEIGSKHPGLSDQQKLLLARQENPSMFPDNPIGGPRGGFPVGGNSDSRTTPSTDDFMAKMNECVKNGDRAGAKHYATEEALRRYRSAFIQHKTGARPN